MATLECNVTCLHRALSRSLNARHSISHKRTAFTDCVADTEAAAKDEEGCLVIDSVEIKSYKMPNCRRELARQSWHAYKTKGKKSAGTHVSQIGSPLVKEQYHVGNVFHRDACFQIGIMVVVV